MLVPKQKFLQYQRTFFAKIKRTPYKIKMLVLTKVGTASFLEDFVGDSEREVKPYELRCLYEKEISPRTREKYGLPMEVNGIIYLSPLQLVPIFGDYHLNWNTTKFEFEGRTQVIDKVVYLEEFKEYKGCVGIQIFVKDDLKGG